MNFVLLFLRFGVLPKEEGVRVPDPGVRSRRIIDPGGVSIFLTSFGSGKSGGKKKRGGEAIGVEGGVSLAGRVNMVNDVVSLGVDVITGTGVETGVRT